jgi:hypothetical protein
LLHGRTHIAYWTTPKFRFLRYVVAVF